MDMNEASAMTEASGLVDGQERLKNPSSATSGKGTQTYFPRSATDLAEQLRKMTIDTPLHSLSVAFLLGAWVALALRTPRLTPCLRKLEHLPDVNGFSDPT
jgi:hypothetical protein